MKGVKHNFPVLTYHPDLVYLDSAATTLLPEVVIQKQHDWYKKHHAPVHRGIYQLAIEATEQYEAVRQQVSAFLKASSPKDIIFTSNATAGLNLVASFEAQLLKAGDEIIVSRAEHHSNLLPWKRLAQQTGAQITWLPAHEEGSFPIQALRSALSPSTKLVAVSHVSNVLGYIAPLAEICKIVHSYNARVCVDAAQSFPSAFWNVQDIPVDYAVFSGHKLYGPEGTGFVYAKHELIQDLEPLVVGGGTVAEVTTVATKWLESPHRFEAGSPNTAGIIGLGEALKYMESYGLSDLQQYMQKLTGYALPKLQAIPGLTVYGPATDEARAPIFSFTMQVKNKVIHSHDICYLADKESIALRGGKQCAEVLMTDLGIHDVTRASCGIYTTKEDIDRLVTFLWTSIGNTF